MSADDSTCPVCGSPVTVGYEVQGVYDGVLYWVCGDCGHARPRFTDPGYRLSAVSAEYAVRHNAIREND